MKSKIIMILCLVIGINCYAQNQYAFENQEYYFCAYYDDLRSPPFKMSFYDNNFYMDIPELDHGKTEEGHFIKGTIQGKYTITTNDRFTYVNVNEKKYLVLYYESRICILIDCANNDAFFGLNKTSKNVYEDDVSYPYIGIKGYDVFYLKTSSYLVEKIGNKVVAYDGGGEKYYYQLTRPWVEGTAGSGIGEWIETEISNSNRIDEVVFFNGYIDPNRPDLYYANGRVKEMEVRVGTESWSYTLKDTPDPQILKLPKLVNGVMRFTIKDVYQGNKYMDTCVAGIYFLLVRGQ